MASSKLMPTTSTSNPDLPRQSSFCSPDLPNPNHYLSQDQFSSIITMDDFLKNIYSYPTPTDPHSDFPASASISREGSFSFPKEAAGKSADEVWKEIVAGGTLEQKREAIEGMTLEDFLTKAGAVREEDVRAVGVPIQVGAAVVPFSGVDNSKINSENSNSNNNGSYDNGQFGNGIAIPPETGKGRQKRRAVEEPPMDKATQQKQRRMIKNRESAARSRERKQAYTIELESLVTQLEEENAKLVIEEGLQKQMEAFMAMYRENRARDRAEQEATKQEFTRKMEELAREISSSRTETREPGNSSVNRGRRDREPGEERNTDRNTVVPRYSRIEFPKFEQF